MLVRAAGTIIARGTVRQPAPGNLRNDTQNSRLKNKRMQNLNQLMKEDCDVIVIKRTDS